MVWLGTYVWTIALVLLAAWGLPGAISPILLAITMPAVLVGARRLRRQPVLAPWTLLTISGALMLWKVSGGRGPVEIIPLGAFIGVGTLWWMAVREPEFSPWLCALTLSVFLVAYFSGGAGSGEAMLAWYRAHGLTEAQAVAATLVFRKTVHLTFYGTVGWLGLRATEAVPVALGAALALASFDEMRQSGYANRTGSAWDVVLDFAGAATFIGLSEWRRRKTR